MKNNKIISKIVDIMLDVLIVLLSIFLLVSLYTAVQVKFLHSEYADFFGYSLFEVQTGSMHGTIEAGDWIIVKATKDVERNDIITYKHGNDFVTHRVIEKYKGSYVTKGDANNTKDEPIDKDQVVGKVVKKLPGFGILKKVFFNPFVIISLIVCLYLFQLTFKTGKSDFDKFIEKVIGPIKNKFSKDKSLKEVKVVEEGMASILDDSDEEKPIENKEEVVEPLEKIEELKYEEDEESEVAKKIVVSEEDNTDDDKFANTAMFRMIDIDSSDAIQEIVDNEKNDNTKDSDENLSGTSLFRIITVDEDEEDEDYQEEPIIVDVIEEKPQEEKKKTVKLEAEKIPRKVKKTNITKSYISEKIKKKKAKNIIDKTFIIKKIMYDEIINVLLSKEKTYIQKSTMRKDFMEQYLNLKYFGLESDRDNLKANMNSYSEELINKYIRDERKTDTIKAYLKAFMFINNLENKDGSINYKKELSSFGEFDDKTLDTMENDITNIMNYSMDSLNEILDKLQSNTFKDQYKKIEGQKNLYGVALIHNIPFSKVYSNYIVDKTYTEGIVAEDKLQVLLNLLLCKITENIIKHDYNSKYIVFIPNALYEKDKKLDKIVSTMNNDYAKNHIYFLTTLSNLISNSDDINRLAKKGYHFALSFNKSLKISNKNLGYVLLADYYFIDQNEDYDMISKNLPKEINDIVIKDDLDKKIGDYKGD